MSQGPPEAQGSPKALEDELRLLAERVLDRAFDRVEGAAPLDLPILFDIVETFEPEAWKRDRVEAIRKVLREACEKLSDAPPRSSLKITSREAAMILFNLDAREFNEAEVSRGTQWYDQLYQEAFGKESASNSTRKRAAAEIREKLAKHLRRLQEEAKPPPPIPTEPGYIHRTELEERYLQLRKQRVIVLSGDAGTGKSTLAKHLARREAGPDGQVYLLRAHTDQRLWGDISIVLDEHGEDTHGTNAVLANRFKKLLEANDAPKVVLIDNLDENVNEILDDVVPPEPRALVIITSRVDLSDRYPATMHVGDMWATESAAMVADRLRNTDPYECRMIAEAVEHRALAIEHVCGYLRRRTGRETIEEFCRALWTHATEMLDAVGDRHEVTLKWIYELTLEALSGTDALKVLDVLVFYSSRILLTVEDSVKAFWSTWLETDPMVAQVRLEKAVRVLLGRSLISIDGRRVRLHQLTGRLLRGLRSTQRLPVLIAAVDLERSKLPDGWTGGHLETSESMITKHPIFGWRIFSRLALRMSVPEAEINYRRLRPVYLTAMEVRASTQFEPLIGPNRSFIQGLLQYGIESRYLEIGRTSKQVADLQLLADELSALDALHASSEQFDESVERHIEADSDCYSSGLLHEARQYLAELRVCRGEKNAPEWSLVHDWDPVHAATDCVGLLARMDDRNLSLALAHQDHMEAARIFRTLAKLHAEHARWDFAVYQIGLAAHYVLCDKDSTRAPYDCVEVWLGTAWIDAQRNNPEPLIRSELMPNVGDALLNTRLAQAHADERFRKLLDSYIHSRQVPYKDLDELMSTYTGIYQRYHAMGVDRLEIAPQYGGAVIVGWLDPMAGSNALRYLHKYLTRDQRHFAAMRVELAILAVEASVTGNSSWLRRAARQAVNLGQQFLHRYHSPYWQLRALAIAIGLSVKGAFDQAPFLAETSTTARRLAASLGRADLLDIAERVGRTDLSPICLLRD